MLAFQTIIGGPSPELASVCDDSLLGQTQGCQEQPGEDPLHPQHEQHREQAGVCPGGGGGGVRLYKKQLWRWKYLAQPRHLLQADVQQHNAVGHN